MGVRIIRDYCVSIIIIKGRSGAVRLVFRATPHLTCLISGKPGALIVACGIAFRVGAFYPADLVIFINPHVLPAPNTFPRGAWG